MENVKSSISRQNKRVLAKAEPMESPSKLCDFRIPSECPLQKKCLTKCIVYKAVIKIKEDRETKEYIGMTPKDFKVRYRNHMKSFKHKRYEYDTKLSKYVWKLKNAGKDYGIKWSILKRAPSYSAGGKHCSLCTEEKLCLLKANKTLNRISDVFAKCHHARREIPRGTI
jgi:hypothetical protein